MRIILQTTFGVAAALALVGTAQANPGGMPNGGIGAGGGIGAAGGIGGAMPGGGMGVGAASGARGSIDLPDRGVNGQIGLDTAASARAAEHARPVTLQTNTHLQTALTNSLTRSGVTLPAGGVTSACTGFGSVGECVAAMHVAQNLNLDGGFAALKTEMTGSERVSLGKAIRKLRPDADAKLAEKRAKAQARAELRASAEASD